LDKKLISNAESIGWLFLIVKGYLDLDIWIETRIQQSPDKRYFIDGFIGGKFPWAQGLYVYHSQSFVNMYLFIKE